MSSDSLQQIRDEVGGNRAIVIVGTGVSVGATREKVASWTGLLEDGVRRCIAARLPLPQDWEARLMDEIRSEDMDDLLGAAEKIASKLGAPTGGEYKRWLRETVGELRPKHPEVIRALRDLGVPLATTNYDDLLEQVTGWPSVTWQDRAEVERVLRGDVQGILHFHGHWRTSESVILGLSSAGADSRSPTRPVQAW